MIISWNIIEVYFFLLLSLKEIQQNEINFDKINLWYFLLEARFLQSVSDSCKINMPKNFT